MASMSVVKCKCCGKIIKVRTADVKRGWGKFCSKSCKAKNQGYSPKFNPAYDSDPDDDSHICSDYALGQWQD